MCRHLQFLLEKYHEKIWIYETANGKYPRWNYSIIQTTWFITKRLCVYENRKIHLWTDPILQYCQLQTEAKSFQIWLWDITHYSQLVVTPNTAHSMFTGTGWFWCKIWHTSWYQPSPRSTKTNIQYLWGLGRQYILWTYFRVEILKMEISGLHEKLRDLRTAQIPTSHPWVGPKSTPSMDAPKLWCYKTIGNSLGYLTTNPRGTQYQDLKNSGHFPILYLCCVQFPSSI